VIVTTYNREDALAAVLRSLASQKDRNFEVLVADDGSAPATAALIERHKPQSRRLRLAWRLCRVPRRRLPHTARFYRDPSAACRARLVRHRQSGFVDR